jgi:hypothetical protein
VPLNRPPLRATFCPAWFPSTTYWFITSSNESHYDSQSLYLWKTTLQKSQTLLTSIFLLTTPFPILSPLPLSLCLACYSNLKMDAAGSSKTLGKLHETVHCHIPGDSNCHC